MRILIDECVDPPVKTLFEEHTVSTVHDVAWNTLKDGELLVAAQRNFDVLITIDRSLEFQQNLKRFSLGIVVARVRKNQLIYFQAMHSDVLAAVERVRVGEVIQVVQPQP